MAQPHVGALVGWLSCMGTHTLKSRQPPDRWTWKCNLLRVLGQLVLELLNFVQSLTVFVFPIRIQSIEWRSQDDKLSVFEALISWCQKSELLNLCWEQQCKDLCFQEYWPKQLGPTLPLRTARYIWTKYLKKILDYWWTNKTVKTTRPTSGRRSKFGKMNPASGAVFLLRVFANHGRGHWEVEQCLRPSHSKRGWHLEFKVLHVWGSYQAFFFGLGPQSVTPKGKQVNWK